jgi:hypothetical protein
MGQSKSDKDKVLVEIAQALREEFGARKLKPPAQLSIIEYKPSRFSPCRGLATVKFPGGEKKVGVRRKGCGITFVSRHLHPVLATGVKIA